MKTQWLKFAVALVATAGMAAAQGRPRMALPGTLNYFEGQVSVNGQPLDQSQLGKVDLTAGGVLDTGTGRAELLLSPGVILRAGHNSEIRMVSTELAEPRVEVVRGEALVEVDQKPHDATLGVALGNTNTSLLKQGLYRFNGTTGAVQVIDGKAQVNRDGESKDIGKGKQILLSSAQLKGVDFDRNAEDDLYRWSSVRSDYLAQASASSANVVYAGAPYDGTGWYWNPYFTSWAWLPGDGYFFSPFGYPFYSPAYIGYSGFYGRGGWAGGYHGGHAFRGGFPHSNAFVGGGFHGGARGGIAGGGFHGGGMRGGGGRR